MLIKLRWGQGNQGLLIKNAPKFIKFALGENVKQSNSSSKNRYPRTRMGVEQTFVDAFIQAQSYRKRRKENGAMDLTLEAMVEVLEGERFVTCHSYVQSEIRMLIRVAERFGFRIQTFTHGLEAYKVAQDIKKHGAGVSTFSDWWGYKYEVKDAIPYNASLLNDMGIVVAINSDDPNMARRLNQEAAKAMLYGNTSEDDALKMVTLNPAKLLRLDKRMGSLKVGKDADIVLWDKHPLSVYAQVEKTFIDGICYYDKAKATAKQKLIKQEKAKLVQKLLK